MNKKEISDFIKREAGILGFQNAGIAKADFLEREAKDLELWLKKGLHGEMKYMENYFDKRVDPRKLMPGAKSIISLSINYFNPAKQLDSEAPKISQYAYGQDYHLVIKEKLKNLLTKIQLEIGDVEGRAFVDSAPVMDKAWAERAGLGWRGKNTNLINKKSGSFFFLAELMVDIELAYDQPGMDHCGTCTKCIDACPTEALQGPYQIDASKCISYLTIELKKEIPQSFEGKMDNWMFGCDICQDVCPWNSFSLAHTLEEFKPLEGLMEMKKSDWMELSEAAFSKVFNSSAIKRTKHSGLKRNIQFLKNKN